MRELLLLSTAAVFFGVPARADQIDKDKLRQAACMPTPFQSLSAAFYSDPEQGPRMMAEFRSRFRPGGKRWLSGEKSDIPAEITRIEQVLMDHPDDAGAWYRLGRLRRKQGQAQSSRAAYARAVELYRQQAKVEPANGRPLAGLGKTLRALERDQEAETALRQGVERAPEDWVCWLALHSHLYLQAQRTLGLFPDGFRTDQQTPLEAVRQIKLTRQDAVRTQQLTEEAWQCVEKAVACAPREIRVLATRANARSGMAQMRLVIDKALGKKTPRPVPLFTAEFLADLRIIADLAPQDPHAQAVAILCENFRHFEECSTQQPDASAGSSLPPLPATVAKRMQVGLKRLETVAAGADELAVTACIYLAILQQIIDVTKSEPSAREAVRRAPHEEICWDLLLTSVLASKHPQRATTLCKDRLKHKDSAYNRYLVAFGYGGVEQYLPPQHQVQAEKPARAEKDALAEKHLRLALRQDPNDPLVLLGLAALLLHRSEDPAALKEAAGCLLRAEPVLKGSRSELVNEFTLMCGIYRGLIGRVAEARRWVAAIQSIDPENASAQAALKALGEASDPP